MENLNEKRGKVEEIEMLRRLVVEGKDVVIVVPPLAKSYCSYEAIFSRDYVSEKYVQML